MTYFFGKAQTNMLKSYCVKAHADEKLHQHVTVRKNIYYIFRACARSDLLPSFHKIKPFSKLRYVLGARLANSL